jgi:Domain of unknown function (DUF4440)
LCSPGAGAIEQGKRTATRDDIPFRGSGAFLPREGSGFPDRNDGKGAVLHADRSTLDKLLSADLSDTHSSAKTQTKEQLIQEVTSGATVDPSIDLENTKIRPYGSAVVITHSAVIVTGQTGTSRLYLTEVRAQESGRWQRVSRQADQASLASSLLRGCELWRSDFGQIAASK